MATETSRPLNAFESVFAENNVRFAVVAVVEGASLDAVIRALNNTPLGHLQLEKKADEWFLNAILFLIRLRLHWLSSPHFRTLMSFDRLRRYHPPGLQRFFPLQDGCQ